MEELGCPQREGPVVAAMIITVRTAGPSHLRARLRAHPVEETNTVRNLLPMRRGLARCGTASPAHRLPSVVTIILDRILSVVVILPNIFPN